MSNNNEQKSKIAIPDLLLGIISVALGAVLLIFPNIATAIVISCVGIGAIVIGIVNIIRYLRTDAATAMLTNYFAFGLIFMMAGLVMIICREDLIDVLNLCIGFAIMIGGCFKLQGSITSLRLGGKWILTMIAAGISLAFGVLIIFKPFSVTSVLIRVIGIGLIYEGAADYIFSRVLKKRKEGVAAGSAPKA